MLPSNARAAFEYITALVPRLVQTCVYQNGRKGKKMRRVDDEFNKYAEFQSWLSTFRWRLVSFIDRLGGPYFVLGGEEMV